jgi:hypothetical protein
MGRTQVSKKGRRTVDIDVRVKHTKAVRLRSEGLTYDEIAGKLGYSDRSAARKAVVGVLQANDHEAVSELRALEGMRLDAIQSAHWKSALEDPKTARLVLAVIERRHRLFGLEGRVEEPQRTPEEQKAWLEEKLEEIAGLRIRDAERTAASVLQHLGWTPPSDWRDRDTPSTYKERREREAASAEPQAS